MTLYSTLRYNQPKYKIKIFFFKFSLLSLYLDKMSQKMLTLLFSLYILTICIQSKQVHAFSFFDLIRVPLGQVSESIFGWNPFKLKNPLGSSYLKTSIDDFDLLKTANNLTNDTISKSHYKYGCTCLCD